MSESKHIGLVLPNVPSYSETFFISKIKGLYDNGFIVTLFSRGKKTKHFKLCPVVYLPVFDIDKSLFWNILKALGLILANFGQAKKLFQLNRNDGFSLGEAFENVLINSTFLQYKLDWLHFGFGTMALQRENVAEAIGAKMAVSFRGFDWYVYPIKNKNCYCRLFSKDVKYHVLSDGMIKALVSKGVKKEVIVKITPAIHVDLFKNENFSIGLQQLNLLTVGRLHWIKGYDYLFQALALLKNQAVNFNYTIIGEGMENERLIFEAHQLGISNNVRFVGKVGHDVLHKYYKSNQIYIQYSIQEGFCNAVLEAQAAGMLCVVSDAEGLLENVEHNKTGWIVPKRNPEALAEKILDIFALSTDEKIKISKAATERVKNNFTIENQINQFILFYQ